MYTSDTSEEEVRQDGKSGTSHQSNVSTLASGCIAGLNLANVRRALEFRRAPNRVVRLGLARAVSQCSACRCAPLCESNRL
jgi:hypothetical protein